MSNEEDESKILKEHATYSRSWGVGPDGRFRDLKKEGVAHSLAQGLSLKEVSQKHRVPLSTLARWSRRKEMKLRKGQLNTVAPVRAHFHYNIHNVVAELLKNALAARADNQYKASNDALLAVYRIAEDNKNEFRSELDVTSDAKNHVALVADLRQHLTSLRVATGRVPQKEEIVTDGSSFDIDDGDE